MAKRFAREGAKVLLAAKMTSELRKELADLDIALASGKDDVGVEEDDVHLILEYKREETWGKYTSPRANRCCGQNGN